MAAILLSEILDDLRAAEEGLHKFERRYWISSADFYELYSHGRLDDGSNAEDFAEWSGHFRLRLKRQAALEATFPHHRHEPPDIKHNRRPAPGISFAEPNLTTLIADCMALGAEKSED